jgi:hypothetical protein
MTPEQALIEFKVATDTYLPRMDAETKHKAVTYVTERAKVQTGSKIVPVSI